MVKSDSKSMTKSKLTKSLIASHDRGTRELKDTLARRVIERQQLCDLSEELAMWRADHVELCEAKWKAAEEARTAKVAEVAARAEEAARATEVAEVAARATEEAPEEAPEEYWSCDVCGTQVVCGITLCGKTYCVYREEHPGEFSDSDSDE